MVRVERVNEFLWWTWAPYDRFPVLVVTKDAPPDQVRFARDFAKFYAALGGRVIFDSRADKIHGFYRDESLLRAVRALHIGVERGV